MFIASYRPGKPPLMGLPLTNPPEGFVMFIASYLTNPPEGFVMFIASYRPGKPPLMGLPDRTHTNHPGGFAKTPPSRTLRGNETRSRWRIIESHLGIFRDGDALAPVGGIVRDGDVFGLTMAIFANRDAQLA